MEKADTQTHYDHQTVQKKWQDRWLKEKRYHVDEPVAGQKQYVLDMFPYPSGQGLHVGHPLGYIASDIVARYYRTQGKSVLHPIGWDAFGLPAENYAIKTGVHPRETTEKAIPRYREQLQMIGLSYDWDREVNTSSPDYYKWTQWLFLQLYKQGVAYKKEAPVNWCPKDQTVLANEQVKDGQCERCDTVVEQRNLAQWFFRITDYTERLLEGHKKIDWPESIKLAQQNWIGRSEGAELEFNLENTEGAIKVFTTRPDTLFGATFLVLAPEHPLALKLTTDKQREAMQIYLAATKTKKELERKSEDKPKTGVFTGSFALNPVTQKQIPIWVADYVLMGYGTGAIMAVPAHDERDWAFATAQKLPIVEVIRGENGQDFTKGAYPGEGRLVNSDEWNDWQTPNALSQIISWLEKENIGTKTVTYRLRDWLVSRQRYWGAPIPIILCEECGDVPVPEDQLPVRLPDDVDFKPTGESPLVGSQSFHTGVSCPKCGRAAKREVDTIDTFIDSSWYFLRYPDAHNDTAIFDSEIANQWLPVDIYVGGREHATGHLIFARFITKFLYDQKLIKFDEPFMKLRNQGLILGEDQRKMSKRWDNVVNPDDIVRDFGADALRAFEMFMGPLEESKPWSTQGLVGVRRWLDRIWRLEQKVTPSGAPANDVERVLHQTITKITHDIEEFQFNTAISQLMILTNSFEATPSLPKEVWQTFLQLLAPFVPHLAHELWERAGLADMPDDPAWPVADPAKLTTKTVTLAIQVNGKLRGQIETPIETAEEIIKKDAAELPTVKAQLMGKKIIKIIIIPGRIVNFVVQ